MMPALLGWGSFGHGVWGVPWGRGRKDAPGIPNVPFCDVFDIPFWNFPSGDIGGACGILPPS